MRNEEYAFEGAFSVIKGVLTSLGLSLLLAIVFAVILRTASLGNGVIYPVNQGIKGVSVAIGAGIFVKGEKGWLKGMAVGILFTALSYLAFSAIGHDFSLSWMIFLELLLSAFTGALGGIIGVNRQR